jgi:hypothetical protein
MAAAEALAVGFKEMAGPTLEEQHAEKLLGDGIFLGAGVYALTIPNFYFRQEYDHDDSALTMTATGTLNQAGADVGGHYIVDYPSAGRALAHITREYPLPNETWLYGTAGQIRLNSTWGPSAFELNGELHNAPFMAPAPSAKGKWSGVDDATTWRSGLAHEIVECMECIGATSTFSCFSSLTPMCPHPHLFHLLRHNARFYALRLCVCPYFLSNWSRMCVQRIFALWQRRDGRKAKHGH